MLHLYISHSAADKKTLDELLTWLKPLQEKYFLRVWYDRPLPTPKPLPFIWQLLLFWYTPPKQKTPYHPDLPGKVKEGHIYLFLVSHASIATPHINDLEVPAAVERYVEYGEDFIRIFPVLVSPSQWKTHSKLAGFPVLGPEGALSKSKSREDDYLAMVEALEKTVEDMRKNWLEHYHLRKLPTDEFYSHEKPALPPPQVETLPGWIGWILLLAILYSVTSWFTTYCAPRMYYHYKPEVVPEYPRRPDVYFREHPVEMPDTVNIPPQDEKR